MRLLTSTLLGLSVSALALSSSFNAEAAKTRHHASPNPVAAAPVVTPAPAAPDSPAVTGRNADGTLHAPDLSDAPSDDFLRVAWCHGVLSGDMELAEIISSIYPEDKDLRLIGTSYLRAYEAALTLSGKGKSDADHQKAEDVREFGYNEWAAARDDVNLKEAAGTYANWQLPGDCEHAAVRLSGHPNLFAEMATDEEVDAITAALTSGGPHDYNEMPKPVLTAQSVPDDPNAPVATNRLATRNRQDAALPQLTTPVETGASDSSSSSTDDNHGKKGVDRKWSEGLAYRLGWSNTKGH